MTDWQQYDANINGIQLHFHRTGGDKPPLLLLHGITDSGQCWPLVADALSADYDIIAVDARGHGKSAKPETGYSRRDHAGDVAGLIEWLKFERPAVMGHSMGAGTASTLAALYPSLVGVLVLEDPPWREEGSATPPSVHASEWEEQIRTRKGLPPEELLAQGRLDNPTWPEAVFAPWIQAKYDVSPDVVKFITPTDMAWQHTVPKIECPTLLITAEPELGAIVTAEVAAQVQDANDRIQVAYIPGAGHNIRREQPEVYLAAVRTFLDANYPPR